MSHLWAYRDAIRLLTWRELQVRYSNSMLGVLWSLLNPLVLTVVFSIVFGLLVPNPLPAYPVFFLAGLLPWNAFSLALLVSTQAITANSNLVNRVFFPREVLPISGVLATSINFVIALFTLGIVMLVYQVGFSVSLVWLPLLLLIQTVFSIGLGLSLSALNTRYRDIQQVVEVLILPLFFATPIFYNLDMLNNPGLRQWILILNPIASLISAYRDVIYHGVHPDGAALLITIAETAVVVVVGALVFRRLGATFSDVL